MNNSRIYRVVLGPITTEKTTLVAERNNQLVFHVANDANKREIKKSIEEIFKVDVVKISTLKTKGKSKRFAQRAGKRNDVKKAYVKLASGQDIDFATGE